MILLLLILLILCTTTTADTTAIATLRKMRLEMENEMFCPDRYIGDLFVSDDDLDDENADMMYLEAKRMIPHWKKNTNSISNIKNTNQNEESQNNMNEIIGQLNSIELNQELLLSSMSPTPQPLSSTPDAIPKTTSFFTQKESMQLASIQGQIPPLSQITKE